MILLLATVVVNVNNIAKNGVKNNMKMKKLCCALVLSLTTLSSYAVEIEKNKTSWNRIAAESNKFLQKEEKGIPAFFEGLERSYLDNPRQIPSVTLKEQIIKLIEKCDKLTDNNIKNIRNLLGKPSKEVSSSKQLTYGWLFEDGDVIVIREFSNQDRKVSLFTRICLFDGYFDKNYKNMSNYFAHKVGAGFHDRLKSYWQDLNKNFKQDGAIYYLPYNVYGEILNYEKAPTFDLNEIVLFKDSPAIRRLLALKPYYQTEGAKTWLFDNGYILSYDGTKKFDKDGNLRFVFEVRNIDNLNDDRNFDFRTVQRRVLNIDESFTKKYVLKGLKSIARDALKTGKINVIPAEKLNNIAENQKLGIKLLSYRQKENQKFFHLVVNNPSYRIENGYIPIHVSVFDNGYIYTTIIMDGTNDDGQNCYIVEVSHVDELKKKFGLDFDKLEKIYIKKNKK